MPFVLLMCTEFSTGSPHDVHRQKCLEYIVEFNEIISSTDSFFDAITAERLKKVIIKCLQHYAWLSKEAADDKRVRWKVVLKHHYFYHMALRSHDLNPKFLSCYMDESLIGRMMDIVASCLDGAYQDVYQKSALEKYLFWLSIDLDK